MPTLNNINIILGVSAGIAAYKSAEIIRLLSKNGANIRVVMTEKAPNFITPITLQSLSGHPVRIKLFDPDAEAAMSHIELAKWADIILIAPATANIIAEISHGFANSLLSTLWLASTAQKFIAPAMNQVMWNSLATQANVELLKQQNIQFIGPESGEQACGDVGFGRMSEALDISSFLSQSYLDSKSIIAKRPLAKNTVLITAGPTVEAIDPVRYISNYSSGKMGYALAQAALDAGAKVILVSGPTQISPPNSKSIQIIHVTTAQQMLETVIKYISHIDIFIGCAAVADYRPESYVSSKIKKDDDKLTIHLVKNPDIVKQVSLYAHEHNNRPYTVAFAAETDNLQKNAKIKLKNKNVDLLAANLVGSSADGHSIGFNNSHNELFLFYANKQQHLHKNSKKILSQQLIKVISTQKNTL